MGKVLVYPLLLTGALPVPGWGPRYGPVSVYLGSAVQHKYTKTELWGVQGCLANKKQRYPEILQ